MVDSGTPIEVATMKVWPDGDGVKPTYSFFVNERIDLLIREAETFRNDYRNKEPRHVFLALEKPLPFADIIREVETFYNDRRNVFLFTEKPLAFADKQVETMKFCGWILLGVSVGCGGFSAFVISRQNRSVR